MIHYVILFQMVKGFATLKFACGYEKDHPDLTFIATHDPKAVTCVTCLSAMGV